MDIKSSHISVTHLHLFSVVNTYLQQRDRKEPIRILDIGCGDGNLLVYFQDMMTKLHPDREFEIYGFDVTEQGHGVDKEFERPINVLSDSFPDINWRERIKVVSMDDPWPYPTDYFDAAVSNQVLEHVSDPKHFFSSLKRVLRPDGMSAHLFPLQKTILEAHIKVPFAHWFTDQKFQQAWIAMSNRLGVGRWKQDKIAFDQSNLDDYARDQSHYLNVGTFYRNFGDFNAECKEHALSVSYHHTSDFFLAKIRQLLGLQPKFNYGKKNAFLEFSCYSVASYLSSVCLLINPVNYDVPLRIHQEKKFRQERAKLASVA